MWIISEKGTVGKVGGGVLRIWTWWTSWMCGWLSYRSRTLGCVGFPALIVRHNNTPEVSLKFCLPGSCFSAPLPTFPHGQNHWQPHIDNPSLDKLNTFLRTWAYNADVGIRLNPFLLWRFIVPGWCQIPPSLYLKEKPLVRKPILMNWWDDPVTKQSLHQPFCPGDCPGE